MAKRKENSRRPQPRHKRKLGPSQFDKRRRLATPNPNRKKTVRARVPLSGGLAAMAASMGGLLDARMGFRLAIIMAGIVLAGERRVAAAWFVAGGVQDDWDRFYGHNWVSLAMVVKHSLWGVIALPLRSMLYVRAANCPKWTEKYGWEFRTKHEQLIDLVAWFVETARGMGLRCAIWLAVDGAYAARPFLRAMGRWSVVVVSRLRKDAALFDLPEERAPGKRGRHPIYG
ncbi:MAG: transposase, partial [Planctomycetes bacterium]|nr:transposase [Planctomycetota bacterium]